MWNIDLFCHVPRRGALNGWIMISFCQEMAFLDFTWHCSTAAAGLVTLDFISNTAFYTVKWVFSPQLHFPHSSIFLTAEGNRTCKFDQILWPMLSSTKIEDLKVERFARARDWTHDLPVQSWTLYRLSYQGNCYLDKKTGSLYIAMSFLDSRKNWKCTVGQNAKKLPEIDK